MVYKNTDDLPLFISVSDLSTVMGISLAKAYALSHTKDFPSIRLGRRILIPKLAFIKWMQCPVPYLIKCKDTYVKN